jgi:acyl-CoA synthetase (AMP-forming)/AMP-acid ligase II
MSIDFLLDAFERYGARPALVWRDETRSYQAIRDETRRWIDRLEREDLGLVVALASDYSPRAIALLLALLSRGRVVSLLTKALDPQKETLYPIAQVHSEVRLDDADEVTIERIGHVADEPLLRSVERSGSGGLVLFSSGSAGKVKAVVHDARRLLEKYRIPRRATVTIPFMLFDHIGGINTLLHTLSSGGTAVIAPDRSPETICRLIAQHKVQVLPTTPTFINLLLMSDWTSHDLSSLEILAYGAERMPASALARLRSALPKLELVQNYGLSEIGIMRTKSESSDSLWVKLGGDGYETRVVGGLLEIKAKSAMLGYLNEPSPFTDDGWLRTGDRVEVDGEYVRILGRQSDIIIVGGEKVYPAEVEDLILEMSGVLDVTVRAEQNAITGQIVKAEVQIEAEETRADFQRRMSAFLSDKLADYKIPQKVALTKAPLHNARLKKTRAKG